MAVIGFIAICFVVYKIGFKKGREKGVQIKIVNEESKPQENKPKDDKIIGIDETGKKYYVVEIKE